MKNYHTVINSIKRKRTLKPMKVEAEREDHNHKHGSKLLFFLQHKLNYVFSLNFMYVLLLKLFTTRVLFCCVVLLFERQDKKSHLNYVHFF